MNEKETTNPIKQVNDYKRQQRSSKLTSQTTPHRSKSQEIQEPGDAYIIGKQKLQNEEKIKIAKYVLENYIEDYYSVAIDAGSTSQQIIEQMMQNRKFLSILTNNMTAFRQNSKQNVELTANEFILTGGKYVALFDALLGNETINSFELFHPHIVIIGASGFIANKGFFCHGNDEKAVKKLLFEKRNISKVIIPVDYSKLGRSDSYLFGEISDIKIENRQNCEVVIIPPLAPTVPKRTGKKGDDESILTSFEEQKKEYEGKKADYENKKEALSILSDYGIKVNEIKP